MDDRIDESGGALRLVAGRNLLGTAGELAARQRLQHQRGDQAVTKQGDLFGWMENGRLKSVLIGTIEKYPTQADAERAVEHLPIKINNQNPQSQFHAVTVGGLIDRFVQQELPNGRRFQAQTEYRTYFNRYIRPQWGDLLLDKVNPTFAVRTF